MQVLGVLDSPAQVGLVGVCFEGTLVEVQYLPVGAIADRVGVDLETLFDRDRGGALDLLDRLQVEARAVQVLVGLQEPAPPSPPAPPPEAPRP
jgi:hypothetical protein